MRKLPMVVGYDLYTAQKSYLALVGYVPATLASETHFNFLTPEINEVKI